MNTAKKKKRKKERKKEAGSQITEQTRVTSVCWVGEQGRHKLLGVRLAQGCIVQHGI